MQIPQPRPTSIAVPIRRLLLMALAALVLLPALGMALGQARAWAGAAVVLAAVWLAMAGVGLLRQRGARRDG